jgi:AmmeMemoRadiSam system protein B
MATRPPAVAGSFYEASPDRLRAQVAECFDENPRVEAKKKFIAAVVPHAGLMYSGHVAAAFYGLAELPKRYIILCPNHTGLGHPASINREGEWRTPLGNVPVDTDLASKLMSKTRLLTEDARAHAREHSLEVQLPFLQQLLLSFTFVPICLATHQFELCEEIGNAIADVVAAESEPIGILASSDLNHYQDQKTTLKKDQQAIDQVLALDARGLWDTVLGNDISMCGFIPTTATLVAAAKLGASSATLIKHATSGDINGDYSHVVGYAAILVS